MVASFNDPTTLQSLIDSVSFVAEYTIVLEDNSRLIHWQDADKAIQKALADLQEQGVETITWHCLSNACDQCSFNDKQTVKLNERFMSGAYLPPQHGNCNCEWSDHNGNRYAWTGVDGVYKQIDEGK